MDQRLNRDERLEYKRCIQHLLSRSLVSQTHFCKVRSSYSYNDYGHLIFFPTPTISRKANPSKETPRSAFLPNTVVKNSRNTHDPNPSTRSLLARSNQSPPKILTPAEYTVDVASCESPSCRDSYTAASCTSAWS